MAARVLFLLLCLSGCASLERRLSAELLRPLAGEVLCPDALGLAYDEDWIEARDGERLRVWRVRAMGDPRGTVVLLHV